VSPNRDDLVQLAELLGTRARELATARYPAGVDGEGSSSAPAGQARQQTGQARQQTGQAGAQGLDAVRIASELAALATAALRLSVGLARDAGRTWQELGDVLGVTRQAAFQRFGHPVDPRTGEVMSGAVPPGAAARATQLMIDWIEARYGAVRGDFNSVMSERMSADGLAAAWAELTGQVGRYEQLGEAAARQARDLTIVDIPLSFEAGEMKGRVVYDRDGKVTGLFVLRPDAI
jgi:uncharacterized protein DUF3887